MGKAGAWLALGMPIVSTFLGITIRMYFGDHPPPHIHVAYQGFEALVRIHNGRIIRGDLPSRVRRLVAEWIMLRKRDILANWNRAEQLQALERIPGLDDEQP